MRFIIPECAWPRRTGKQIDSQSWDAALDVVQETLLGMAIANHVNDEEDRLLTEFFKQCEELRAKIWGD